MLSRRKSSGDPPRNTSNYPTGCLQGGSPHNFCRDFTVKDEDNVILYLSVNECKLTTNNNNISGPHGTFSKVMCIKKAPP